MAKNNQETEETALSRYDAVASLEGRFDNLGANGTPVRLGLLGGTFDPIHVGHLRIAEEVRQALDLQGVLFIPTGNPVFKRDQEVTDAHTRLEWVHRAIMDNPHFDVSPLEVEREGDTYTVETLRALHKLFPENVEFYFIVGSDAAASMGKWRCIDEIAKLTQVAVAWGRPGNSDKEALGRSLAQAGFPHAELVEVTALDISSSAIRQHRAQGQSVRYLVPQAADIEGLPPIFLREGTDEALTKEFYKARKDELALRVSSKRFKHSLGVAKACEQLAKQYGLNARKARLAGLLHDWDKGLDDQGARNRVYELGMEDAVDPFVVTYMPAVLHGNTAARALARDFACIPGDVLQAIDRHTTADEHMSPLDMVLYIADAIEPNRQFGRIDELRASVGQLSLEDLYFKTYEYWVFLLFERGKPLHPDTIRIWNAHAAQRVQRKKEKRK